MAKDTTPDNSKQTEQNQTIAILLKELEVQKEANKALSEKVEILYRAGDKNKIKQHTPKIKTLPLIKITTYNDVVVVGWKKMTANKVIVNNNGEHAEQRSVYILSEDGINTEEMELEYSTFHTNKQMVDAEVTRIEPIMNEHGEVEATFYHFEYNGIPFKINTLFVN